MQSSLSVTPYRPSFRAATSEEFINAANGYYKKLHNPGKHKRPKGLRNFKQHVKSVATFGKDDWTISFVKIKNEHLNTDEYLLYAYDKKTPNCGTVLSRKNHFRQILEHFIHMNKTELTNKIDQNESEIFFHNGEINLRWVKGIDRPRRNNAK